MSGWIEEQGVVVAADDAWATVRVERKSTCGSCSARSGCGNGVLAQVLGRRELVLRLANTQNLRSGDRVILGVRDDALVSGALVMYLLPLFGLMLFPAMVAALFPALHDGWMIPAGIAGFALGLAAVRRWMRGQGRRFDPVLLGHQIAQPPAGGLSGGASRHLPNSGVRG